MKTRLICYWVLVGMILGIGCGWAEMVAQSKTRKPARPKVASTTKGKSSATQKAATNVTTITSKTLDFDYNRSIAVFETDVVVVDAQIRIESDKLTLIFDEKTKDVRSVTAQGGVRMMQDGGTGTCHTAIYKSRTGEIIMVGNAVLRRPTDSIGADRITFFATEEGEIHSVQARGSVRMTRVDGGGGGGSEGFSFGLPGKTSKGGKN